MNGLFYYFDVIEKESRIFDYQCFSIGKLVIEYSAEFLGIDIKSEWHFSNTQLFRIRK